MVLRRKQKLKLRRILSTPPVAGAIINSGPLGADANPIQINGDGEQMPSPRFEHGGSSGARSCRRSSPESHRAQENH